MSLNWTGPDALGVFSAPGIKRLPFAHGGRDLEVRAVHDGDHGEWIIAVKDGDRFVAPSAVFTVSNEKIFDAKMQGGMFENLLVVLLGFERDAVVAGDIGLLDRDAAPDKLTRAG